MKRAFSIMFALALVLSFSLVATMPTAAAPPQTWLWGVTGVNFYGVGDYSEVFRVDTSTGVVTIIGAHTSGSLYTDIAMTPNGKLYTVGMDRDGATGSTSNFNDLYRLDPSTGAVLKSWVNVFPANGFRHVNALAAEGNTSLLAIEGGGVCPGWGYSDGPKLLRINLDASGDFSSITDLGTIAASGAASMCSDGDLDRDPTTCKWYAGFWAGAGSEMVELNLASPGSSTVISQSNISWQAGFAFLSDGTAYASSWADEKLYTVNVPGGGSSVAFDLSSSLAGPIYGLCREYPSESVATAAGTGAATFATSQGCIRNLTPVIPPGLPSVTFPHGMFSFQICCLDPGESVVVTVTLPSAIPVGTVWWKYDNGRWSSLPNLDDDGDNVMKIRLTDGGAGDSDSVPGQITDPGGPGNPMTVGWEGSPIGKSTVLWPWIALVAAIAAGLSLLVLRRRRSEG